VVNVANGDGGQYAHYIIDQTSRITQIDRFEDKVVAAVMGPDDALYLSGYGGYGAIQAPRFTTCRW
jgi:prolyl oligopeptidase